MLILFSHGISGIKKDNPRFTHHVKKHIFNVKAGTGFVFS